MFDNLGQKIETWATINYCCGVIASLMLGVFILSHFSVIMGICVIVIGIIATILQSYMLAALGQIAANTHILAHNSQPASDPKDTKVPKTAKTST